MGKYLVISLKSTFPKGTSYTCISLYFPGPFNYIFDYLYISTSKCSYLVSTSTAEAYKSLN